MRSSDISEEWAAHALIRLVPQIDGWMKRFESGPIRVMPGSPMSADDQALDWMQLSHAAWSSLSNAVDNLHTFRSVAISGSGTEFNVTTRPYGAYAPLRATVENAATALYLLGPANRNERLTRRLRLYIQDGRYVDGINDALGNKRPCAVDERLAKMATIIAARSLDQTIIASRIGYAEIVGRASECVDRTPGQAKAMWQILSGLTHGQLWATLAVTDYETLSTQITDRALNNRVTSSVAKYAGFCATACVWVGAAFDLYDRRCSAPSVT